jgi:hypothetical protein
MLQIHPNARTTPAVRGEIARSSEPSGVLARSFGVSMSSGWIGMVRFALWFFRRRCSVVISIC